jgi:hypothetical protein
MRFSNKATILMGTLIFFNSDEDQENIRAKVHF